MKRSEIFERYAAGLARKDALPAGSPDPERRRALVDQLVRLGARGWPERGTIYTRTLPKGCGPCLEGQGSNLALTTLCTRDCFFCFNPKPRADNLSVHGRAVDFEDEVPDVIEELDVRSLGLSGGEPLLDPARVLRVLRGLRRRFGPGLRLDLYTNGDLLTPPLLAELHAAGLDGLRLNLAANGYHLGPVALALTRFKDVEVEIPAIPSHKARLFRLVRELDSLGVPHLILHELFVSAHNLDALRRNGCRSAQPALPHLTWSSVQDSDETALEVLLYGLKHARRLSLYYCSCATQQWIAEKALARKGA